MDNQGKPKGEWTKKAILDAVKACCEEEGVTYDPFFDSVRREYLFDLFMDACGARRKSRHARETWLYGVSADVVFDVFAASEEEEAERLAYFEDHGFRHDSLAALLAQPEGEYEMLKSTRNGRELVIPFGWGSHARATLYTDRAEEIVMRGFSALDKGGC